MLSRLWNWFWDLGSRSSLLRRLVVRYWYEIFTYLDRDGDIRFMNYGYADPDFFDRIRLDPVDEPNRYQIQLYHRTATKIDLRELDVLEIGSGHGGGAAYICANLHPRQIIGVDISTLAVHSNNRLYSLPNLFFLQGDAERLEFNDESFDVVLNIESSSHYGNFKKFLSEVQRVLRPNGHLLFADIRQSHEIPNLFEDFQSAGLTLFSHEDIAKGVVKALELDEARKVELMKRKTHRILHGALKEFGGTKGSEKYNSFLAGKYKYLLCVLRKEVQLSNS